MTRKRKKVSPFTVLNYLLFIVIGIIMVYPFWYVVMYSFSDPTQSSLSSLYLLPQGFTLESYKYAFSKKILFIANMIVILLHFQWLISILKDSYLSFRMMKLFMVKRRLLIKCGDYMEINWHK